MGDELAKENMDVGCGNKKLLDLRLGSPGVETLKGCSDLFLEATKHLMTDCDLEDVFMYGKEGGDEEFKQQLAEFLSQEYGDTVEKDSLMMTSGATQGLHVALTLLVSNSSPVFVVDPTYFNGTYIIETDLQRNMVPVPSDQSGPLMEEFEEIVKAHLPADHGQGEGEREEKSEVKDSDAHPYSGAVYLVPTFNNPTSISYTPDMCRELISLARRHNLLLLADDVYNLLYFTDFADAPKRLLAFDSPSDPDYGKGHVLSNGTFSKVFAPAIRLGWIEGPKDIIWKMTWSFISSSGGAYSHYVGKLMTQILKTGKQREHLAWLRTTYKDSMRVLCDGLEQHLPSGCNFHRPKGGYFVWVELKPGTDGEELLKFCQENYSIIFLPGVRASPTNKYKNYVRLTASYNSQETLSAGARLFSEAYTRYLDTKGTH